MNVGKARQKSSKLEFTAAPENAGSYVCVARNILINQIVNSEPAVLGVQGTVVDILLLIHGNIISMFTICTLNNNKP